MSAQYLDWHVGMKVVCVRDEWTLDFGEIGPVAGAAYTVRTIEPYGDEVFIRFVEIVNPVKCYDDGTRECDWLADDFRPVQTRKTSIAIFEALLNPSEAETFRELEAEEFDYELNEEPFR